jgi:hypothetical protein
LWGTGGDSSLWQHFVRNFDAWMHEVQPQTIEMAYEIAAVARICGN